MDSEIQINSVIVKINMDGTENEPRFVVEEVSAHRGNCFEGVENLHRARFECLCCKTGYVVFPLIMQTAPIQGEMEVSIPEDTLVKDETGSTFEVAVDFNEEQMERELLLDEHSFEMEPLVWPLEDQAYVDQVRDSKDGDFDRTTSDSPLDEFVDLSKEQRQDDRLDSVEKRYQARVAQSSETVIGLDRVDEEAREEVAPVAPIEPQERIINGDVYTCDICKASIKYRKGLVRHMKIHLGIRLSCSECQEFFSREFHLNIHKKRFHHREVRSCEVCEWSQSCTKAEYLSHLRSRHPGFRIADYRPKVQNFNGVDFPCIFCEPQVICKNFEELEDHLKVIHNRKFTCTLCPKAFNRNTDLNHHIETVHEKKKFKCPQCNKIFAWERSLRNHRLTHK